MTRLRKRGAPEQRVDDGTSTFIPLAFRRHGVRKVVALAAPAPDAPPRRRPDDDRLVRGLARGFYWQSLLDRGVVANLADLAEREQVDKPRLTKLLRLARLAPDLVQAVWRGDHAPGLTLEKLIRAPLPAEWEAQRRLIEVLSKSPPAS